MNPPLHSVLIQWSPEDQCYVVTLPEWGPGAHTHGKTYVEAAQNAQEVLELLMEDKKSLPAPNLFVFPDEQTHTAEPKATQTA